jgi:glycosyltransferase involved in cell wall biosynthesis
VRGNVKSQGVAKRVLFVSYYYPPDGEIGAKRAARLAKCLMENGWWVGVLTVEEKFRERIDRSYDVPGVDVYRTSMFQSMRFALPRARHLFARFKRVVRGGAGAEESEERGRLAVRAAPRPDSGAIGGGSSWIRRFIFSMIWLPDDRQGWVPFGLRRFLGLLSTYSLAYSSSPPASAHLIPLFASHLTRKFVWVAEFRDPWTTFPKPAHLRTKLGDWLEEKWEASVIARSARVVVVTEAMKRDLAEKYPAHADKIRVYSNGFDRDELAPPTDSGSVPAKDKTTFVYAGQFAYGRNPRTFLRALSELIDDGALARKRVRVVLMSNMDIDGESIEEMVRVCRLEDVVECVGYVPYDQCVREMSRADVLLLFSIDQPLEIPAKIYEYLALNKRILSVSTGGITEEMIDRTGSGLNVKPDDISGMKKAILTLISGGGPTRNEREVQRFDIRSIVRALSEDLDGLTKHV